MLRRKLSIAIVIILLLVVFCAPVFERFTITDGSVNKIVYVAKIADAKEFYISFKHSVNRTPVNEFYKIENNSFIVYKTTFYSYGAGMPEYAQGGKEKISFEDGLVLIENIDRELKSFGVMVGTYADHMIFFEDKNYHLSQFVKPQKPAIFKIKKVSLFTLLRRCI